MKKLLLIISLLLIGCNGNVIDYEIIDYEKESTHFNIRDGKVFYKGKPLNSGLKYSIKIDDLEYNYFNNSFKDGIPFIENKVEKSWDANFGVFYGFLDGIGYFSISKDEPLEFDETLKDYFGFLSIQSKKLNKKIEFELNYNEKYTEGKIKMVFPEGKLTVFKKENITSEESRFIKIVETYFSEFNENGEIKYDLNGIVKFWDEEEDYSNQYVDEGFFKNGKLNGNFILRLKENANPNPLGEYVEPKEPTIMNVKFFKGREVINEDCKKVAMDYLNTLGLTKILWLHDEGYAGGVCTGKPNQYCGRVEKLHNGQYWTYDVVVFVERNEYGECKVTGTWDNL